jgi:hypothetical protein
LGTCVQQTALRPDQLFTFRRRAETDSASAYVTSSTERSRPKRSRRVVFRNRCLLQRKLDLNKPRLVVHRSLLRSQSANPPGADWFPLNQSRYAAVTHHSGSAFLITSPMLMDRD